MKSNDEAIKEIASCPGKIFWGSLARRLEALARQFDEMPARPEPLQLTCLGHRLDDVITLLGSAMTRVSGEPRLFVETQEIFHGLRLLHGHLKGRGFSPASWEDTGALVQAYLTLVSQKRETAPAQVADRVSPEAP